MELRPTERFTGRVESYRLHRPRYPDAIVDLLRTECDLDTVKQIVDIAAGTGLLTEIFLKPGYAVTAVEPNDEMRAVCCELASEFSRLRCVAGTAEDTRLPSASADCITVAQAMHWFDLTRTRQEFARVLRPGGWCAVIYNERRMGGDAFHDGYEKLLSEYGKDYAAVQRQHLTVDKIAGFFAPSVMRRAVFPNAQDLSFDGLTGRILSSSYMPKAGEAHYSETLDAIGRLFRENECGGYVRLEYDCAVYYGQLGA